MAQNIKKEGNQFYIGNDVTSALAVISFFYDGNSKIIIDHTYVSRPLRGQGIGKELVDEVVKFARQNKLRIVPLCSYAERLMKSSDEYVDVL